MVRQQAVNLSNAGSSPAAAATDPQDGIGVYKIMIKFSDLPILDIGHSIQVEGAVFLGDGKMYIVLLPGQDGDFYDPRKVVYVDGKGSNAEQNIPVACACLTSEEWTQLLRQTDLLETEVLTKSSDGTVAKAILRKSARQIDQGVSWRVFKRDGYKCRYCGADDVPLTVDHLVRWEEGGPSIEANLLSACRKCNKTRGNMSYEDWLQSPKYRQFSSKLDAATKAANVALVPTLAAIPRVLHVKSR